MSLDEIEEDSYSDDDEEDDFAADAVDNRYRPGMDVGSIFTEPCFGGNPPKIWHGTVFSEAIF